MKLSEWGMRKKEGSHVEKILKMTKDRSPARLRRRILAFKNGGTTKTEKSFGSPKLQVLRYEITKEEWRQGKRITGESVVGIYRGKWRRHVSPLINGRNSDASGSCTLRSWSWTFFGVLCFRVWGPWRRGDGLDAWGHGGPTCLKWTSHVGMALTCLGSVHVAWCDWYCNCRGVIQII